MTVWRAYIVLALSIASTAIAPRTLAALPTPATCPATDATKTAGYQAGFTTGCTKGLTLEEYIIDGAGNERVKDSNDYCTGAQAPTPYRPSDSISANQQWVTGCYDGFTAGDQAYLQNAAAWPTTSRPNPYTACTSIGGYTTRSGVSQTNFLGTCILSYRKAVNNPRLADQNNFSSFQDFNAVTHNTSCEAAHGTDQNNPFLAGCRAGYSKATEDFEAAFPAPPAPSAAVIARAQKIHDCNSLFPPNAHSGKGYSAGCVAGYDDGFAGDPNSPPAISYDARSVKQRDYYYGHQQGYTAGYALGVQQKGKCATQGRTDFPNMPCATQQDFSNPGGGIVPACDPSLAPSEPGACGIPKFIELIKNIMQYLYGLAIPLAVLALAWGGFQIMTSAGNPGKVEEGQGVMKLAITGLVIMLASYLIIRLIFTALGVDSSITQGLF